MVVIYSANLPCRYVLLSINFRMSQRQRVASSVLITSQIFVAEYLQPLVSHDIVENWRDNLNNGVV